VGGGRRGRRGEGRETWGRRRRESRKRRRESRRRGRERRRKEGALNSKLIFITKIPMRHTLEPIFGG
jgi:hypothetical protein